MTVPVKTIITITPYKKLSFNIPLHHKKDAVIVIKNEKKYVEKEKQFQDWRRKSRKSSVPSNHWSV